MQRYVLYRVLLLYLVLCIQIVGVTLTEGFLVILRDDVGYSRLFATLIYCCYKPGILFVGS